VCDSCTAVVDRDLVAVTLTYAAPGGHALIGRVLYLPGGWAADDERRELAGVPDNITFETKPQLAGHLLQHAHDGASAPPSSPATRFTAAVTCARASGNAAPDTSWPSAPIT
jgi:hypothetical protein